MAKPVVLRTRTFKTKKAALDHFRAIRDKYKPGDQVSHQDASELKDLLDHHDERTAKVGCGISHLEVGTAEGGTVCFYIRRSDGSLVDFSFYHCVDAASRR